MTTEEKLDDLLYRWTNTFSFGDYRDQFHADIIVLIAAERRAAKREERERCAKWADELLTRGDFASGDDIRALKDDE